MKIIRYLKFLLVLFACLLIVLGVFVFFTTRPALDQSQWPKDGMIQNVFPNPSNLTPNTFSLATYNIGYASGQKNNQKPFINKDEMLRNLDEIVSTLRETHADIIALQEVDFNSARTFHENQMEYIAQKLDTPYRAYVTTWNLRYVPFPYWPVKKHFGSIVSGQCVLSKYPIADQTVHRFNKPTTNAFWYNWFYLDRVMQHVRIQIGDDIATVWNVHLEAFDKQARQEQALFVAQAIRDDASVIKIALGDFNSASFVIDPARPQHEQETVKFFAEKNGLKNAENSTVFFTMPSWKPKEKIDHIFIPANFTIENVGTIQSTASDHLPVWATVHMDIP